MLPTALSVAAAFQPQARDGRLHVAVRHTRETNGICRNGARALDMCRCLRYSARPPLVGVSRSGNTRRTRPHGTPHPRNHLQGGLPTSIPVLSPGLFQAAPNIATAAKLWPPLSPVPASCLLPRTTSPISHCVLPSAVAHRAGQTIHRRPKLPAQSPPQPAPCTFVFLREAPSRPLLWRGSPQSAFHFVLNARGRLFRAAHRVRVSLLGRVRPNPALISRHAPPANPGWLHGGTLDDYLGRSLLSEFQRAELS